MSYYDADTANCFPLKILRGTAIDIKQHRSKTAYMWLGISTEQRNFAQKLQLLALQWRVFEALLYSVGDRHLIDPAVKIFNAYSSSVLNFRCYRCTVLTKVRDGTRQLDSTVLCPKRLECALFQSSVTFSVILYTGYARTKHTKMILNLC